MLHGWAAAVSCVMAITAAPVVVDSQASKSYRPDLNIPPVVMESARATCRLILRSDAGPVYASGTYIGCRSVVTAAHTVTSRVSRRVLCIWPFVPDGSESRIAGTVVAHSHPGIDTALVVLDRDPPVVGMQLAAASANRGDLVYLAGYPRTELSQMISVGHAEGETTFGQFFAAPRYGRGRVIPGQSGGAAINARGEYLGSITGYSGDRNIATNAAATRRWLTAPLVTKLTQFFRSPAPVCRTPQCRQSPPRIEPLEPLEPIESVVPVAPVAPPPVDTSRLEEVERQQADLAKRLKRIQDQLAIRRETKTSVDQWSDEEIQSLVNRLPGIRFSASGGTSAIGFLGGLPIELNTVEEQ